MRRAATLAALAGLCALPAIAGPRSADDVRQAQQRHESSTSGVRRDLLRDKRFPETARDLLRDVQFVYRRDTIVDLRSERRFGTTQVVVSDGWMELSDQLLRAAALGKPPCLTSYAKVALEAARNNRQQWQDGTPSGLRRMPTLETHVDAGQCPEVGLRDLKRPKVDEAAIAGTDAMLTWLTLRQLAQLPGVLPGLAAAPPDAAGCPDLDADARALAWSSALKVDLHAALPAIAAHAALFSREGCAPPLLRLQRHVDALGAGDAVSVWRPALP